MPRGRRRIRSTREDIRGKPMPTGSRFQGSRVSPVPRFTPKGGAWTVEWEGLAWMAAAARRALDISSRSTRWMSSVWFGPSNTPQRTGVTRATEPEPVRLLSSCNAAPSDKLHRESVQRSFLSCPPVVCSCLERRPRVMNDAPSNHRRRAPVITDRRRPHPRLAPASWRRASGRPAKGSHLVYLLFPTLA